MGMGEPFHNYDTSQQAIHRLMNDLGIGARHITVSTVGLVPQIQRFADEGIQVKLAISLHAATDAERMALLPVNKRWPLTELMDACRDYIDKRDGASHLNGQRSRVKMIRHNSFMRSVLLKGMLCHVNIIPLNPTGGYHHGPSAMERVNAFTRF